MKIQNIANFRPKFFARIDKNLRAQIERARRKSEKDSADLLRFEDNLKRIEEISPDMTLSSYPRANSCTGKALSPIVVLRDSEGNIFPVFKRVPDSFYKKVVKAPELSTPEGVEALRRGLEEGL